jgi:hypothetical protein
MLLLTRWCADADAETEAETAAGTADAAQPLKETAT